MNKKTWIICIAAVLVFLALNVLLFIKTGTWPSPFVPVQPIWPPIIHPGLQAFA